MRGGDKKGAEPKNSVKGGGEPESGARKALRLMFKDGNFLQVLRVIILILLGVLCVVVAVSSIRQGALAVIMTSSAAFALVASMAVKIFAMGSFRRKIVWYVFDSLVLIVLTVFSSWRVSIVYNTSYCYLIYALVLSEYYLSAPTLRDNFIMFAVNLAAYTVVYVINALIHNEVSTAFDISSEYVFAFILLVLHFVMFNFAMTVSRKNKQIEQNLRELEDSRNELLRAYEKVEEATVIEERNRIAKDIHDTAGHSLTTVIMQTEAARLAVDKDPAEAKQRIAAANLQAKNCLEELRLSVHLLSGRNVNITFKQYLENILGETADVFTIRSKIDDIELTDEAERFIANTLREGISNGIRHGGSTAFFFELKDAGNYVEMLLSDNGSGVNMADFKEGFGLSGMRAKAESLGGMVNFSSEEGEGFEIRLSLPGKYKVQPAGGQKEDGNEN